MKKVDDTDRQTDKQTTNHLKYYKWRWLQASAELKRCYMMHKTDAYTKDTSLKLSTLLRRDSSNK